MKEKLSTFDMVTAIGFGIGTALTADAIGAGSLLSYTAGVTATTCALTELGKKRESFKVVKEKGSALLSGLYDATSIGMGGLVAWGLSATGTDPIIATASGLATVRAVNAFCKNEQASDIIHEEKNPSKF